MKRLCLLLFLLSGCQNSAAFNTSDVGTRPEKPNEPDPALPGTQADANLQSQLDKEANQQTGRYEIRTHHKDGQGNPKYINRLIFESSPYLLQHAHNPINWYPWSDDAFARAQRENKMVFLSVGYSTCHWCHVMERESFEDIEIATFINQHFIPIKVDREERPDIDKIYMRAVYKMRGSGGWPMTVIMTFEGLPLFAGTYFPPRRGFRGRREGLIEILHRLQDDYQNKPHELIEEAQNFSQTMIRNPYRPTVGLPSRKLSTQTSRLLVQRFDKIHGGFGRAPKFPRPANFALLLDAYEKTRNSDFRNPITLTLRKMGRGGLYDHVGGGFHRYSTDTQWLVPHFEKMLYDQAQLIETLVDVYLVTKDPEFRDKLVDVCDYLLREMQAPNGGYYSATDADSMTPSGHREEGYFFTWTEDELKSLLPNSQDFLFIKSYFRTSSRGNFEGRNILHTPRSLSEYATDTQSDYKALKAQWTRIRKILRAHRNTRPAPLLDDKIISGWNGLTIGAMAHAGRILGEPRYIESAIRAAKHLAQEAVIENNSLVRTVRGSQKGHPGFIDDYAFVIYGLLQLFESTGDENWFNLAKNLQAKQNSEFWDPTSGGYYFESKSAGFHLHRQKPDYDGAIPTGNSYSALNLKKFAMLTGDSNYDAKARALFRYFGTALGRRGLGLPKMVSAYSQFIQPGHELVVVHPQSGARNSNFKDWYIKNFSRPSVLLEIQNPGKKPKSSKVPLLHSKATKKNQTTAYYCVGTQCTPPVNTLPELKKQIKRISPSF